MCALHLGKNTPFGATAYFHTRQFLAVLLGSEASRTLFRLEHQKNINIICEVPPNTFQWALSLKALSIIFTMVARISAILDECCTFVKVIEETKIQYAKIRSLGWSLLQLVSKSYAYNSESISSRISPFNYTLGCPIGEYFTVWLNLWPNR